MRGGEAGAKEENQGGGGGAGGGGGKNDGALLEQQQNILTRTYPRLYTSVVDVLHDNTVDDHEKDILHCLLKPYYFYFISIEKHRKWKRAGIASGGHGEASAGPPSCSQHHVQTEPKWPTSR